MTGMLSETLRGIEIYTENFAVLYAFIEIAAAVRWKYLKQIQDRALSGYKSYPPLDVSRQPCFLNNSMKYEFKTILF